MPAAEPGVLAAYLSAHRTMINGSALCAALAVTERDLPGGPDCSQTVQNAEYGVSEGAGLRFVGSRRMASSGESWNCLLEAAGAFAVALAARRSWFCYHQLFAVLLRFERRRTGLAEMAALPHCTGRSLGRALAGPSGTWPAAYLLASRQAGPGRPLGVGLAAYVACSACGRSADARPGG
jgi:hypothetical protein